MKNKRMTILSVVLAALLTVMVLLIVISTGVARVHASEVRGQREAYVSIRIADGDSLWSIAETYRTDDYATTADFVKKVASLNHLSQDATIHTGAYLLVPVLVEEE